jgi:tetratricopeptide (TPR) repeat protein
LCQAQERFNQRLASFKRAGKSLEAAQLEKTFRNAQSAARDTDKLDTLMQTGWQAFRERHFDEADIEYKQALQMAEKLQPHDVRLATTLGHLGNLAAFRNDFATAGVFFERQLKVAQEISGTQVPMAEADRQITNEPWSSSQSEEDNEDHSPEWSGRSARKRS